MLPGIRFDPREEENMSPNLLYALILLAALAHATWNALVKSATDRLLTLAAIRLVGLLFGLAVLPFVPWPSDAALIWLGLACGANFAYHGLLIQSYRVGDLSLVYPLARGSAPVLLALTAFMAIDERLSPAQIVAVILITGGILALVIGKGSDRTAVGFALATGISIATLKAFHDGASGFFVQKELYLLRNLSKGRGVGFFEAGNFHPDFIFWLIRAHWAIENSLHWIMDMVFRDDECRVRTDNARANFATCRHIAYNLTRKAPGKDSIRLRRKTAGWDDEYLASLIAA
jgi:multidrug transporter EmrE-like cation transporter